MSMYDLNDESIKEDGGKGIFPLGISEGNYLVETTVADTKDGNKYLKFVFENKVSGTQVMRFEFDVNDPSKTAEEIAKKIKSQLARIKHIVTKYVGEGTPLPTATSFEELITKVAKLLPSERTSKIPLRVLTHYNYKDFVAIPDFVPFIELQSVSKDDTKLKISSIHKMEKDTPDEEQVSTASSPIMPDDLPADMPFLQ